MIPTFDYRSLQILLASPDVLRYCEHLPGKRVHYSPSVALNRGEVRATSTYNYRDSKPVTGGLFCEHIFGRLDGQRGHKAARRGRSGHIKLASPTMHVWFFKNRLSHAALLTNRNRKHVEKLIYGRALVCPHRAPFSPPESTTAARQRGFAGARAWRVFGWGRSTGRTEGSSDRRSSVPLQDHALGRLTQPVGLPRVGQARSCRFDPVAGRPKHVKKRGQRRRSVPLLGYGGLRHPRGDQRERERLLALIYPGRNPVTQEILPYTGLDHTLDIIARRPYARRSKILRPRNAYPRQEIRMITPRRDQGRAGLYLRSVLRATAEWLKLASPGVRGTSSVRRQVPGNRRRGVVRSKTVGVHVAGANACREVRRCWWAPAVDYGELPRHGHRQTQYRTNATTRVGHRGGRRSDGFQHVTAMWVHLHRSEPRSVRVRDGCGSRDHERTPWHRLVDPVCATHAAYASGPDPRAVGGLVLPTMLTDRSSSSDDGRKLKSVNPVLDDFYRRALNGQRDRQNLMHGVLRSGGVHMPPKQPQSLVCGGQQTRFLCNRPPTIASTATMYSVDLDPNFGTTKAYHRLRLSLVDQGLSAFTCYNPQTRSQDLERRRNYVERLATYLAHTRPRIAMGPRVDRNPASLDDFGDPLIPRRWVWASVGEVVRGYRRSRGLLQHWPLNPFKAGALTRMAAVNVGDKPSNSPWDADPAGTQQQLLWWQGECVHYARRDFTCRFHRAHVYAHARTAYALTSDSGGSRVRLTSKAPSAPSGSGSRSTRRRYRGRLYHDRLAWSRKDEQRRDDVVQRWAPPPRGDRGWTRDPEFQPLRGAARRARRDHARRLRTQVPSDARRRRALPIAMGLLGKYLLVRYRQRHCSLRRPVFTILARRQRWLRVLLRWAHRTALRPLALYPGAYVAPSSLLWFRYAVHDRKVIKAPYAYTDDLIGPSQKRSKWGKNVGKVRKETKEKREARAAKNQVILDHWERNRRMMVRRWRISRNHPGAVRLIDGRLLSYVRRYLCDRRSLRFSRTLPRERHHPRNQGRLSRHLHYVRMRLTSPYTAPRDHTVDSVYGQCARGVRKFWSSLNRPARLNGYESRLAALRHRHRDRDLPDVLTVTIPKRTLSRHSADWPRGQSLRHAYASDRTYASDRAYAKPLRFQTHPSCEPFHVHVHALEQNRPHPYPRVYFQGFDGRGSEMVLRMAIAQTRTQSRYAPLTTTRQGPGVYRRSTRRYPVGTSRSERLFPRHPLASSGYAKRLRLRLSAWLKVQMYRSRLKPCASARRDAAERAALLLGFRTLPGVTKTVVLRNHDVENHSESPPDGRKCGYPQLAGSFGWAYSVRSVRCRRPFVAPPYVSRTTPSVSAVSGDGYGVLDGSETGYAYAYPRLYGTGWWKLGAAYDSIMLASVGTLMALQHFTQGRTPNRSRPHIKSSKPRRLVARVQTHLKRQRLSLTHLSAQTHISYPHQVDVWRHYLSRLNPNLPQWVRLRQMVRRAAYVAAIRARIRRNRWDRRWTKRLRTYCDRSTPVVIETHASTPPARDDAFRLRLLAYGCRLRLRPSPRRLADRARTGRLFTANRPTQIWRTRIELTRKEAFRTQLSAYGPQTWLERFQRFRANRPTQRRLKYIRRQHIVRNLKRARQRVRVKRQLCNQIQTIFLRHRTRAFQPREDAIRRREDRAQRWLRAVVPTRVEHRRRRPKTKPQPEGMKSWPKVRRYLNTTYPDLTWSQGSWLSLYTPDDTSRTRRRQRRRRRMQRDLEHHLKLHRHVVTNRMAILPDLTTVPDSETVTLIQDLVTPLPTSRDHVNASYLDRSLIYPTGASGSGVVQMALDQYDYHRASVRRLWRERVQTLTTAGTIRFACEGRLRTMSLASDDRLEIRKTPDAPDDEPDDELSLILTGGDVENIIDDVRWGHRAQMPALSQSLVKDEDYRSSWARATDNGAHDRRSAFFTLWQVTHMATALRTDVGNDDMMRAFIPYNTGKRYGPKNPKPIYWVPLPEEDGPAPGTSDAATIYGCWYSDHLCLRKLQDFRTRGIRVLGTMKSLMRDGVNPGWMALRVLSVSPPDTRPMVALTPDQMAVSDLNKFYQRILIHRKQILRARRRDRSDFSTGVRPDSFSPGRLNYHYYSDRVTSNAYECVKQCQAQMALDNLMENGKAGAAPLTASNDRVLKSISDNLKGKKGRFRQNLLGKRVDYSGRSVIVVGPTLRVHQCGLPYEMAFNLFQNHVIRALLHASHGRLRYARAKAMVRRQHPRALRLLARLVESRPVLLNRAPTLHRLGFQAFQATLVRGRAILLHPLACSAFNADFDGDQMAVHLPMTRQSSAEAWALMWSCNHLRGVATGDALLLPSQDIVLGCYYLTSLDRLDRWKILLRQRDARDPNYDAATEIFRDPRSERHVHRVVWYRSSCRLEFPNDQRCFELQLHRSGFVWSLTPDSKTSTHPRGPVRVAPNRFVKTTVGRVLAHAKILNNDRREL